MDWEPGVNICRLLPLECNSNEILLHWELCLAFTMEPDNVRKRMYTCMCKWITMLYSMKKKTVYWGN